MLFGEGAEKAVLIHAIHERLVTQPDAPARRSDAEVGSREIAQ